MSRQFHLRRLEEKDTRGMLEWMHDPSINRWFKFDPARVTEESVLEFIRNSFTEKNRHYAVVDESDEYLGTISLEDIDNENGHALFSISMRSCAIGTGAASAAAKELLCIAFEQMGLERVYLNVLSDNERARRFYEKTGFRFEGRFRRHLKLRGEWQDWDWYAILLDEYNAGNN